MSNVNIGNNRVYNWPMNWYFVFLTSRNVTQHFENKPPNETNSIKNDISVYRHIWYIQGIYILGHRLSLHEPSLISNTPFAHIEYRVFIYCSYFKYGFFSVVILHFIISYTFYAQMESLNCVLKVHATLHSNQL